MILILTSHYDDSSDQVIDWLNYHKAKYIRLNDSDVFLKEKMDIRINNNEASMAINNSIFFSEVTVAWYRKFGLFRESEIHFNSKTELKGKLHDFFTWEFEALMSVFNISFSKNFKWLCNPNVIKRLTKIQQLIAAKKIGLDIPSSVITNDRTIAKKFIKENDGKCLIKPIGESEIVDYKSNDYQFTPRLFNLDFFKNKLLRRFFPSLLQEYLDKEIELRIFFLDDSCYTMAIFSQLDPQTSVDFRNYNYKRPNRWVPFNLPSEISCLIKNFMQSVNLNTGSIDMVKTKNGRYVFLEVNPKGQFEMVSKPCNYNLEEKIALSLIQKSCPHVVSNI